MTQKAFEMFYAQKSGQAFLMMYVYFSYHVLSSLERGAPVAQWVKRWPTDLADGVRSSLEVKILDRKRSSIAHSLSFSSEHRPDMTEILLKRT